jgi:hypothetical protein
MLFRLDGGSGWSAEEPAAGSCGYPDDEECSIWNVAGMALRRRVLSVRDAVFCVELLKDSSAFRTNPYSCNTSLTLANVASFLDSSGDIYPSRLLHGLVGANLE